MLLFPVKGSWFQLLPALVYSVVIIKQYLRFLSDGWLHIHTWIQTILSKILRLALIVSILWSVHKSCSQMIRI